MSENQEFVWENEDGITVRVDIEAMTALVQEMLCKGKNLKFQGIQDSPVNGIERD